MSRNYELMQKAAATMTGARAGEFTELLAIDPLVKAMTKEAVAARAAAGLGQMARQEVLRLVQSIFRGSEQECRSVVFAAISSGAGCSWICAKTAEILAGGTSGKVCLVDANFRAPSLAEAFATANHFGLSDALRANRPVREFVNRLPPPNLWLLSCGSAPESAIPLLGSEKMMALVDELRQEFEYVLIDAPPISAFADTLGINHLGDGLVLILEANVTRREVAARATERLREMKVDVLGAVLNKRTFPIPNSVYHRL